MTKIIVTIGPNSIDIQTLVRLKKAGATSFRINLSHSNTENLELYFKKLKESGVMPSIDTQGAQLRIIGISDNFTALEDQELLVYFGNNEQGNSPDINNSSNISYLVLNHPETRDQISEGDLLKIDFNGCALRVTKRHDDCSWLAKVETEGPIMLNRAVDIHRKRLSLDPLTDFDNEAIDYAIKNGCKEIYASFISCAKDVEIVRDKAGSGIRLISKIETAEGIANVREIIEVSDAILIDRGDLSREVSIPSIPIAVESILNIALNKDCPVFIATNILDSMMVSNIPSRAEISNIYTLLTSGVSGLVLAAEVAIGENPVSSTALIEYLSRLYQNHKYGLHGIGYVSKPSKDLIGRDLYHWL